MPWQTFSDLIYLALLHNALHFIFCNIVLILLYQFSHNGCHTSLNRCVCVCVCVSHGNISKTKQDGPTVEHYIDGPTVEH